MAVELTQHFSLEELTRSEAGLRRGIPNVPNAGEIANLQRLCETILEPIRALLNVPMHVNSGYRCPAVNAAVGGKSNSAHLDGRACDFVPVGMGLNHAMGLIRASGIPFDQLILEYETWIHVSIARVGSDPRGQVLVISKSA